MFFTPQAAKAQWPESSQHVACISIVIVVDVVKSSSLVSMSGQTETFNVCDCRVVYALEGCCFGGSP